MKKTFIKSRSHFRLKCLARRVLLSQKKLIFIILFFVSSQVYAFKWRNNTLFFDTQGFSGLFKNKCEFNSIRGSTKLYVDRVDAWIFDKSVGNVSFYHKISGCKGSTVVFLKFENNNKYNVKISWKEVFVTKQIRSKKEGIKGEKELVIPPGETSSSNCEDEKNKECIILPDQAIPTYRAEIEQFEFKDITVNSAQ